MEERDLKKEAIKVFWIFMIGSIIGCLVETIVCIVQKGHWEPRQGLIYGPFIPVYGLGAVVYYFVISKMKDWKKVFLVSMIVGGAVEYLCSYFQEMWFGTVSWDYSNIPFNIQGRTSLLHCLYWGVGGILFIKLICPFADHIDSYIVTHTNFQYFTAFISIFMIFNIAISCMAAERQCERIQNISAQDRMDTFLDKHYPDKVMNRVYSNKMERIKK